MKKKILPFVIGILVGAIIATAGFLIYEKTNTNNMMPNRERAGEMMNRGDGETPPDKPEGDEGTVPDRPEGDGGMKANRQKNNQNTTDSTSNNI